MVSTSSGCKEISVMQSCVPEFAEMLNKFTSLHLSDFFLKSCGVNAYEYQRTSRPETCVLWKHFFAADCDNGIDRQPFTS